MASRNKDLGLLLDDQLCFALYASSRAVTARYRDLLARLDLTYPQYLVMLVLWEHGALSMGELGGRLHLESGTLTPLVKRLEARGLLTRERSPDDERSTVVAITDEGAALQSSARCVPNDLVAAMGMTPDAVAALRDTLKTLTVQLRAAE